MERETQRLRPADSIEFIMDGRLGRKGRSYDRPALLPRGTGRRQASTQKRNREAGRILGGIGGEIGRRLGGGRGADVGRSLAGGAADYVGQLRESFTPEQEYYLGRAVAAQAIAKYGVCKNQRIRRYVRLIGDAVVRLTNRLPRTYGGYHFEVLDSDEINGVSGPGGFVLITRGAVQACMNEGEIAGILGHELAHCRFKHGEKTLRKGKTFQSAIGNLAKVGGAAVGSPEMSRGLVKFFSSVAGEAGRTAIENGYGRDLEFEADREGTYLLVDVWYYQGALRDFMQRLGQRPGRPRGHATHAPPQARVQAMNPVVNRYPPYNLHPEIAAVRVERFKTELGRPQ